MTAMNDSIMKADRRGRLRYPPEQKTALVRAYQSSGLSAPRFAAIHGVKYQTLAGWLQKHKRAGKPDAPVSRPPAFLSLIPAEIHGPAPSVTTSCAKEIQVPGGAKLAITSQDHVQLAAALIHELQSARPC